MPEFYSYELGMNPTTGLEFSSESLLQIRTRPISTDLCQSGIFYIVTWDDEEVSESSVPVKIVQQTDDIITLQVYTDDRNDIGSHIVCVIAQSVYDNIIPLNPSISSKFKDQTIIEILDNCIDPDVFEATS